MKHFKSAEDLQQLSSDDPAYPIVTDLVQRLIVDYEADGFGYDPEADGWVVLVEPHDVDRGITEIWDADTTLADLLWEGFTQRDGHYIGVYLANNQFGLAVVIPDAPWLNGKLRSVIQYHLDPQEVRHV
jgi:hypothetical protein